MKINCEDCGSSDGCEVYEDGARTHCFVCDTTKFPKESKVNDVHTTSIRDFVPSNRLDDISGYKSYPMGSRGISKEVVDYFNVKMSVTAEGRPASHFYPKTKKGQIVGYKERILPKVSFPQHGDVKDAELFGQAQCKGTKTLVITEGECDAMAMAEAWMQTKRTIYDVVSLDNAPGIKGALCNRDFINRYETVVLMLDMDGPGQEAIDGIAKVIKTGKAKVASLPEKDANDTLLKHGAKALIQAVWNAQTWNPAGIVVGEQVWEQFKDRQSIESIPYPECLGGLNNKLKGIRHGEITLFTSGTGSGKSTVIKEIILDLLDKTDDKVGLISLEESIGDTAEKFISMALERNVMEPPPLSEDEVRAGFDKVFGDERLVLLDHQGSVGDSSLIDKIEYMALMGCKYLVLDHITIAVSEGADGLSGNEAIDKMMSDLLKICKRHNVWLGLISHLRKAPGGGSSFEEGKLASIDDIKGSGSIKQISFDIVSFARNLIAENEAERNTIKFRVLKSRFTGLTGDAGSAVYDIKTTRLRAGGDFDFADFGL